MAVYIVLLILIILSVNRKDDEKYQNALNKVVIIALSLVGLCRGITVGIDVEKYVYNIERTTFNPNSWNAWTVFESGYNYVIACFNQLSDSAMLFIGITNVFFVVAMNVYARHKVERYNLFVLLLFLLGFYFQSFNIMRQYFAMSFMLIYLSYVDMENMTKRQIIVTLALTAFLFQFFHNSTLIMLVLLLYQLPAVRNASKKLWIYALLAVTYIIFYLGLIRSLMAPLMAYFVINEKTDGYMNTAMMLDEAEEQYSLFRLTLDTLFVSFIVFRVKRVNVYIFLYAVGQIYLNFMASLNPLFIRLSSWLFIIGLVGLCELYQKDKIAKPVIISYCFVIFINVLIKNYGGFLPYVPNF